VLLFAASELYDGFAPRRQIIGLFANGIHVSLRARTQAAPTSRRIA
jgi:hypothetical protein